MTFKKITLNWTKTFLDTRKERVKLIGENPENIFIALVKKNLGKNKKLLDIGTGLGKTPLLLASHAKEVWGVDPAKKLIAVAKRNAKKLGKKNVHYEIADGKELPFENETFDVVISQRGPATANLTFAREAFRVLKRGGKLIEIAIGEKDKENIKRIFKRGQNYLGLVRHIKESDVKTKRLEKAGFGNITTNDYSRTEYFRKKQDLILYLIHRPVIPGFELKSDMNFVDAIAEKYMAKEGIKTNRHRLITVAEK